MSRAAVSRAGRVLVALVLLAATGGIFWWVADQVRTNAEDKRSILATERDGTAYLAPLSQLAIELARIGVITADGGQPSLITLSSLVGELEAVDRALGDRLETRQRWSELRLRIENIVTTRPTGAAAVTMLRDATGLAQALIQKIGVTARLHVDAQTDSRALVDALVVLMPTVTAEVLWAATAADPTVRAVHRFAVASHADRAVVAVSDAMNETTRTEMGQRLITALDQFGTAVHALAPPVALDPAAANEAIPRELAITALDSAGNLAKVGWAELDALLADRLADVADEAKRAAFAATAGTVLALVLLWWATPATIARPEDSIEAEDDGTALLPVMPARDMLEAEELLHVGRGVRTRHQEPADAQ